MLIAMNLKRRFQNDVLISAKFMVPLVPVSKMSALSNPVGVRDWDDVIACFAGPCSTRTVQ